jgi:hypothetical protein
MKLRDRLILACFLVMVLLGQWRFGGGKIGITGGGAPSPEYGPVNGRDFVVANANPIQPTKPAGAQDVAVGQFTQTTLNNGGTGKVFWLLGGTHSVPTALSLLQGQKVYCASGAIVDGGNTSSNALVASGATGWEIHGGTWRNQGNASSVASASAIMVTGGLSGGTVLLEDMVVGSNFNRGIHVQAHNVTVRRCETANNGRYGISASENNINDVLNFPNIVFEKIHNHENNTRDLDPGDAAGGSKFSHGEVVLRDSYFHDDNGFSAWWDMADGTGKGNCGAEGCVIEDAARSAIFLEGVSGGAFARYNYLKNNGQDITVGGKPPANVNNVQIRITDADCSLGPNVRGDVSHNDVEWTRSPTGTNPGWALVLWNHNDHPDRCKNWDVKNNRFWFRSTSQTGIIGGHQTAGSGTTVWAGNNVFDFNLYRVASTSINYWRWASSGSGTAQSWDSWQDTFLHDPNGARQLI